MSEYTKGPWRGKTSCTIYSDSFTHPIAIVEGPLSPVNERYANARLIAAAPELLEALQACHLQLLQSGNNTEYAQEANDLARAAIAKAAGK